ncbi:MULTISPECIES: sensor histidine kinase [Streptococcus]|jgi:mcdK|uniref:histidine kinase n=1 Tax=Streptococcus salivarius TaxID=1304 RepID=A0AB37DD99_STRSL|nr:MULTISPECIES: HAMP domain-containing sensor histidine kinase [Streptococcus]MBS5116096.1 HAMP domain-containing histidine kinase [Erysipelotrichaceae bacterium]MBN2961921.1 HAMP domain-containing histidine kinase [Streptococcus sp.]MBS5424820.1 HAMP domain-containing histidine kinase [Streptococcus sp.]MBS6731708.1 HAMP domain-containing histidine kinase [Streptococcus salivarius]MBS7053561.1 HAMP domain-containing histidine kinase [Streptococcus salivarius]
MNIFKKGILKFILAFLTIIFIDFVLLVATTNFIRSQQSPIDIIQGVSSNITPSNGTYKVNQTAKKLIKKHNLWVMILDQKSGNEKFNIKKPKNIKTQFDYADVIKFSRYYLDDYPIFTQIKKEQKDIYIIAFPKESIIRYGNNFFDLKRIQIFPILILVIIFVNCLFCLFLYLYSVTFLNRNIQPIINAIGKLPVGLNKQVNSVQELDRLTLAVNSANKKLRKNEEFKENWISGIAHDIKTPLSVIVANASLAIEKTDNDDLLKNLKPTLIESHYIQNLLNDLNIFARLTNGNLKLNQEITDIIPFFKEIIIQIINQEIWNDFNFEFIPDNKLLGKKMYIEKSLMSRVIHNLIYNSVLHNPSGCNIQIVLNYISRNKFSVIIRDNGIGTSTDRLKNINKIEEFNFDISGVRRSGMGLKISNQIVDLHGGSMIITSEQGEYFQTEIILPIESPTL